MRHWGWLGHVEKTRCCHLIGCYWFCETVTRNSNTFQSVSRAIHRFIRCFLFFLFRFVLSRFVPFHLIYFPSSFS